MAEPAVVLFACVHNAGKSILQNAFQICTLAGCRLRSRSALDACQNSAAAAGRSQMANAWFNALADATKAHSISAGTKPGLHVHAEVQAVMKAGLRSSSVAVSNSETPLAC